MALDINDMPLTKEEMKKEIDKKPNIHMCLSCGFIFDESVTKLIYSIIPPGRYDESVISMVGMDVKANFRVCKTCYTRHYKNRR
jgi:hypothetical protein